MAKLKIPVAKNTTGLLVTPESAEKTEGPFQCPICSMAVLLRAGDVNRAHFAHKPNAACVLPPGETWEHWAAKHLIQQCVRTEPEAIRLHRTCSTCHDDTLQPLPPGPWRAEVEYTLLNDRRPDVVLLDGTDVPRLAIEVHQTHRVDAVKGRAMQLPWIEVEAADILEDPAHWRITKESGLRSWSCRGRRAQSRGLIMPLVSHGFASHSVVCPERSRAWRGRSYANYMDDCVDCEFFVPGSSEGDEGAKPVDNLSDDIESWPRFFSCESPKTLSVADKARYDYFIKHPHLWGHRENNQ